MPDGAGTITAGRFAQATSAHGKTKTHNFEGKTTISIVLDGPLDEKMRGMLHAGGELLACESEAELNSTFGKWRAWFARCGVENIPERLARAYGRVGKREKKAT